MIKKQTRKNGVIRWMVLALLWLQGECILSKGGIPFKYAFKRGNISCITEYNIDGTLPIRIKRTYADGGVELITLDKPSPENAKEVYELVKESKTHLEKYMPSIVESLGESAAKARSSLEFIHHYQNKKLYLFIFFQGKQDTHFRIVGGVAVQGYGDYKEGSKDGMYWLGRPGYIQAKGVAGVAIQALFNFVIAQGNTNFVNLTMHKNNIDSRKIAIRLGMKQIEPISYKVWMCSEEQDDSVAYSLSAQVWRAKHWINQS